MPSLPGVSYVKSVVEEGKKVIWPSREMILRHSVMVIATVAVATVIVAGLDYGFQKLLLLAIQ